MSYHRSTGGRPTTTALPSSKKTHSEQHKQIFRQLLKEQGNKTCADCKTATHPRWASWNLGCFVCIRCSGIHRSMGTHISKVKSVDLDAWTDEQVESMVKWGNDKCNSYWEDKLPAGYVPDQLKIENFIRTKYDLKKWVGSSSVPNPMTISVSTATTSSATAKSTSSVPAKGSSDLLSIGTSSSSSISPPQDKTSANLLDDEFGSFTQSSTNKSQPPLPKLVSPQSVKTQLPSLPSQSQQSTGGSLNNLNKNGRNDLKKSILSLYSSPSSSSSSFIQPQPQNNQPRVVNNPSPVNSLSQSLNGLNLGNSTSSSPVAKAASVSATPRATPVPATSWNNEWADNNSSSSINTGNWGGFGNKPTTSLDDDLFKNVWN